jgi:hypothetical protein
MQVLAGDPPMLALICWLKDENRPQSEGFMIADGMVGTHLEGWWSVKKLRAYRRRLIEDGWIVRIRAPVRDVAALYRWGPTAFEVLFT